MDSRWWTLIVVGMGLIYFFFWCFCAISAESDGRRYDDDPE
jgi:hypothetical protein